MKGNVTSLRTVTPTCLELQFYDNKEYNQDVSQFFNELNFIMEHIQLLKRRFSASLGRLHFPSLKSLSHLNSK